MDTFVSATSPAAKLVLMLNDEASIHIYLNEEELKQFIQIIWPKFMTSEGLLGFTAVCCLALRSQDG